MKKTILISTMILLAIAIIIIACKKAIPPTANNTATEIQASASNSSDIDSDPGPVTFKPVSITFGIFSSGNCSTGAGICSMSLSVNNPHTGDPIIKGGFSKDGCMVIDFTNFKKPPLADDEFIMSQDFTIPNDVATALNGNPYTIKAGKYPIDDIGNNTRRIIFTCTEPIDPSSYELAGELHNIILDKMARHLDFTNQNVYDWTISELNDRGINTSGSSFEQISNLINENNGLTQDQLIDKALNIGVINAKQKQLMEIIETIMKNYKFGNPSWYTNLRAFENSIINRIDLLRKEKLQVLTVSATARHSAIYWERAAHTPSHPFYEKLNVGGTGPQELPVPVCGDGCCGYRENTPGSAEFCPGDCSFDRRDGICQLCRGEDWLSPGDDCPKCGNGGCESSQGENCFNCYIDCQFAFANPCIPSGGGSGNSGSGGSGEVPCWRRDGHFWQIAMWDAIGFLIGGITVDNQNSGSYSWDIYTGNIIMAVVFSSAAYHDLCP